MQSVRLKRWRVRGPRDRVDIINWAVLQSIDGPDTPELRRLLAREILGPHLAHKDLEQAEAIFRWQKDNIWYLEDPIAFDFFPTAQLLIWMGAGDCDDHTVCGMSLLALAGFAVGARVILTQSGWHVYGLVGLPKNDPIEWVAYDAAWREADRLGVEFPRKYPDQVEVVQDYFLDLRAGRI